MQRRVVITGTGLISPLGNSANDLWTNLSESRSGIDYLTGFSRDALPSPVGGEATDFTGSIEEYGPLDKARMRAIKKGRKLMCREIEMGVAAAQHALHDAGLEPGAFDPERTGVVFGSDYIMTDPKEFLAGIKNCLDDNGEFHFDIWGNKGLTQVEPLWLLKYLPNMPASHIAIYNDLRGPSNSITLREASSNLSVAEAFTSIRRGAADKMLAGATGTRIHSLRTLHVTLQEHLADPQGKPDQCCRPFDAGRTGMVLGEGSGAVILETLESAENRGAAILGEVVAHASTCVARSKVDRQRSDPGRPGRMGDYRTAFKNVFGQLLQTSGRSLDQIGHLNAHGQSSLRCDEEEAQAIEEFFSDRTEPLPVIAPKSGMGNLGAGSGMIEIIASLLALQHEHLFPIQNYTQPDPKCPVHAVTDSSIPSGDCFITANVTPQGQASGLLISRFQR